MEFVNEIVFGSEKVTAVLCSPYISEISRLVEDCAHRVQDTTTVTALLVFLFASVAVNLSSAFATKKPESVCEKCECICELLDSVVDSEPEESVPDIDNLLHDDQILVKPFSVGAGSDSGSDSD